MKAFVILAMVVVLAGMVSAVGENATVCCERTTSGAFCQNVPASSCAASSRSVPTSCDSTSYCQAGTCYDSNEGTCLDNTPQLVCNQNGGIWSAERPASCNLGCCVLGDQAAFVSLVRCKRLSSFLGLQTNFDNRVTNELACIAQVQQQDKGACVYDFEFQKSCKFTTRADCANSLGGNGTASAGTFYKDKLCSAEALGTICGPSEKTMCAPGKDEVYFVDTCGNPANIYDASKLNDQAYWTNVKTKEESCNPTQSNQGNARCGNCNYLLGSYCRPSSVAGRTATYGANICANLNCIDESGGSRRHGESWCISDRTGDNEAVGSRYFRRICMNGETVTEPCDDFRAEECVQGSIATPQGPFSQAACRVNRWQDCLAQTTEEDCKNTDRRDCQWKEGVELGNTTINAVCTPRVAPGLAFWNTEQLESSKTVCGAGNKLCVVKFEKGVFGNENCIENCECLTPGWEDDYGEVCSNLGDCGPKINYEGKNGFREGLRILINGQVKKD